MSLEKNNVCDLIEVTENGCVQVRTKTLIKENGIEISRNFHRHVLAPGDDYSNEDAKVQTICAVVHTDEVIAEYKTAQPKINVLD